MQDLNSSSDNARPTFYDKFNPPEDVVRCPYGRASVRDALDEYAIASVELYGLISLRDFVKIYNDFCGEDRERTDVDELYVLLLPRVIKNGEYFFYDGYLCHPILSFDKNYISYILKEQVGKPSFIPAKEKFLDYMDPLANLSKKWLEVFKFILDHDPKAEITQLTSHGKSINLFEEFLYMLTNTRLLFSFNLVAGFLDDHNIIFNGPKTLEAFINLVMQAYNESGCWENKGYSPKSMPASGQRTMAPNDSFPTFPEEQPGCVNFHQTIQVGRNDPCICGSGKKYKQCCLKIQESKQAQLSPEDLQLFSKLWFSLLEFVGRKLKIAPLDKITNWQEDDTICYHLRQALWSRSEIITDYLQAAPLNSEEKEILESWRDKHISSEFFVVKHGMSGSFFTRGLGDDGQSHPFYQVKGLRNSIPWSLQLPLPVFVEAVLLPFHGQIVYDGYLQSYDFHMGPHVSKQLQDSLKHAELGNLYTSLA